MQFHQPTSIREFIELSSNLSDQFTTLLAGGTDLLPRYERGQVMPDHLIDLKKLSDLYHINIKDEAVQIGALTSIQVIQEQPLIQAEFTALHMAAHDFAGAQIRHRGTLGGNIVNASPAGDLLPALYAFDALLTLIGPEGERQLPVQEFILGPGKTVLKQSEILVSATLKRNGYKSAFQKVGLRQSMAISVANMAFVYSGQQGAFDYLKIACGAVAPTVVTLDKLASTILDKTSKPQDWPLLIEADISPIDDIRATAKYRKQVVINLVQAFLNGQIDV
ncbi:MAG: FAD binding domain-containing protein [FCB group bacterium]|nr:FAD binding domain-containing protein [FCB group bacterium]MBL7027172.1 FAD binding domain-containing protein [Candidatus Neomarinimicrobiota bacterium]MBL7120593.1 FAD binding domain-containing protein [Candidatus Neomarinimicrobiota bacterium]